MKSQEHVVAQLGEIEDGGMKAVEIDKTMVLLVRKGNDINALGGHCPHYGAELVDGVRSGERLICPWHHAAFEVSTGKLQDPPALNDLVKFEARVDGDNIVVVLPDQPTEDKLPDLQKPDANADSRSFGILGGGAGGYAAAQSLRMSGFKGRITMITQEDDLPYDRPMLSKEFLEGEADADWLPLRDKSFFNDYGIDVVQGRIVQKADVKTRTVELDGGESITFDAMLIATGGEPIGLEVHGADLADVFYLRRPLDSRVIIDAAEKAKRVTIVGAGFIGMEVANALTKRGCEVTVVAPESVPFEKVLGTDIGSMFKVRHQEKGVEFHLETTVKSLRGNGKVTEVKLENGYSLATDFVIVGIGVRPATGFLQGVKLLPDGSVETDDRLRIAEGVYAAGDIATFPVVHLGEKIRVEHWVNALYHGMLAGRNMAGADDPYAVVPFFWTNQVDLYFRYVGFAPAWDDIIHWGDVAAADFVSFFVKNDRVVAVAGNNHEKEMAAVQELMRLNKMPKPGELRSSRVDLVDLLPG